MPALSCLARPRTVRTSSVARAQITQRLLQEKGCTAVAVEADWTDAYRVNRYVCGVSDDTESVKALANCTRFPTWRGRNADVLACVGWLRAYNDTRASGAPPVGLSGLALYSLHALITAVLGYLDKVDPAAARRARYRYGCLEHGGEDTQAYGYAASLGLRQLCADAVARFANSDAAPRRIGRARWTGDA